MYVKNFTKEQEAYIREEYLKGEMTVAEIAKEVGVNPSTLSRKANRMGLRKTRKTKWKQSDIDWLKDNYNLNYKVLNKHLQMDNETIRLKILELGLERDSKYRPFKIDMTDAEFLSDLDNPRLSAPDIVQKYKDKYGIGESRIHQLRKESGLKLQINTLERTSSAEAKVMEILDELDIVYNKEKRVGRYSIDLYLGMKICIEVQGEYWHNKPDRKATDERKRKYLEKRGYRILYLWENQLENAKEDIVRYLKNLGLPIEQSMEKYLVNASKSGVRIKRANGGR